jgi:MFS family permease
MSPAAHRGELVTWSEMAINVGIVLGFAAGLIQGTNSWRYMFLLGGILPICMIFLVVFIMPETPRWLITKNRDHDAKGILTQLYPEGESSCNNSKSKIHSGYSHTRLFSF